MRTDGREEGNEFSFAFASALENRLLIAFLAVAEKNRLTFDAMRKATLLPVSFLISEKMRSGSRS